MEQSDAELEEYLKAGGLIRKDCWLPEMCVRYDHYSEQFDLLDPVSVPSGERILGVRERFRSLSDIPYAGKWVKCDREGKLVDGSN